MTQEEKSMKRFEASAKRYEEKWDAGQDHRDGSGGEMTGVRKCSLGFQWVDDDGNVTNEIPPIQPCKQYMVIYPPKLSCTGVDMEDLLKDAIEYERVKA
jgi:hypothetical protein